MSSSPPTNSPPECSFLLSNPDLPPPYESPPPYSRVCPDTVQVVICEEPRVQCWNLGRFIGYSRNCCHHIKLTCSGSYCILCGRPVMIILVALCDILLNVAALVFYVHALKNWLIGVSNYPKDMFFGIVIWMCVVAFHLWWLMGACRLFKSSDLTLPGAERRRLIDTWIRVNFCLFNTFFGPVVAVLIFAIITVIFGGVWGTSVTGIVEILLMLCSALAARIFFYYVVQAFTNSS